MNGLVNNLTWGVDRKGKQLKISIYKGMENFLNLMLENFVVFDDFP